ncbi:MAG: DUF952 domain-containing protein [Phycisphaerales bacterium]|nr:DUF952 domain-containing protein [Phycisphaerales bacterium]
MSGRIIYHLIPEASDDGRDPYAPESLQREGFIHATGERDQLPCVAQRFLAHHKRLRVFLIDTSRITARLVDEPAADDDGALYPHIYGPLNRDAIIATAQLRRRPDGTFVWHDDDSDP